MPRYTDKQIEDALRKCKGMVYVAARQMNCSPNTLKARIAKSLRLTEIVEAESGYILDSAELKLAQAVLSGDLGAIRYLLSTKGKDRGYVERQQLEHSGHVDVTKLTDEELRAIIEG